VYGVLEKIDEGGKKDSESTKQRKSSIQIVYKKETLKEQSIVHEKEISKRQQPTVACVLKSGGDFKPKHVKIMADMIASNTTVDYNFVALTDMSIENGISTELLQCNLTGWWSKVELFYLKGPVLYMDLDNIVVDNLDNLLEIVAVMNRYEALMLEPFNPHRKFGNWASAVMAWCGPYPQIVDQLTKWIVNAYGREQMYVSETLEEMGINIRPVQDYARVYSYKRHCRHGKPDDAQIICFHGRPRPWDAARMDNWVSDKLKKYRAV
jgi:hypothetical protein